jgi:hypothetical protein
VTDAAVHGADVFGDNASALPKSLSGAQANAIRNRSKIRARVEQLFAAQQTARRKRATLYNTIDDEPRTIRAHLWSATVLRANKLLD